MNRHTFVYIFMGLTMVALVFGSLPLAVAETSNAPVGVTETFTPIPNTPIPNTPIPNTPIPNTPIPNTPIPNTPVPNTPVPNTPVPAPENTAVPNTPVPAPENTAVPAVAGLPNTGGAAPQGGAAPWILALVASIVVSLGALAFGLSLRAHRPARR